MRSALEAHQGRSLNPFLPTPSSLTSSVYSTSSSVSSFNSFEVFSSQSSISSSLSSLHSLSEPNSSGSDSGYSALKSQQQQQQQYQVQSKPLPPPEDVVVVPQCQRQNPRRCGPIGEATSGQVPSLVRQGERKGHFVDNLVGKQINI
jgi:hypothetical protein